MSATSKRGTRRGRPLRVPMANGLPLGTPSCPTKDWRPVHQVKELGSFGVRIGYGYECRTCWTKFTVRPNGELVLGHPKPAPYPAWDFDAEG